MLSRSGSSEDESTDDATLCADCATARIQPTPSCLPLTRASMVVAVLLLSSVWLLLDNDPRANGADADNIAPRVPSLLLLRLLLRGGNGGAPPRIVGTVIFDGIMGTGANRDRAAAAAFAFPAILEFRASDSSVDSGALS